ncbi:cyclic-di-AMP receptor [Alteribacillus sp. JSM 102045]|uniref:cyclic-di-AMP receptor n=1 Tax=Alteribacillus sp. JSM 102045 TaxID=1562101 RepID=UPI0035C13DA9
MVKLMVCIVNDLYTAELEKQMQYKGYRMTELSSSGEFLKKGNTTFLFGVDEKEIEHLKKDLKEICISYEKKKRRRVDTSHRYTSFVLAAEDAMLFTNPSS